MSRKPRAGRAVALAATAIMAVGAVASCSADQSGGSQGASDTFVVGLGAGDAVFGSFYLAAERGYYADEGLDVEIQQLGSNTTNAVVAGQADVGSQGPGAAMLPVRDGKDMILIAKSTAVKGVVVGGPGTEDVGGCTRMGTQTLGTSTYAWTVMYEEPFGADYEMVNFPDYPTIQASLASGNTNCVVLNYTSAAPILTPEVKLIGDPTAPDFPPALTDAMRGYAAGAIWGDRDHLEGRRSDVEAFLRAFTKADQEMATGDPAELAATLKQNEQYKSVDTNLLADSIAHEQRAGTYYADQDQISQSGWDNTVKFMVDGGLDFIDPDDENWSYGQRVDMSFLN